MSRSPSPPPQASTPRPAADAHGSIARTRAAIDRKSVRPARWFIVGCWSFAAASVAFLAALRLAPLEFWPATLLGYGPRWVFVLPWLVLFAVSAAFKGGRGLVPLSIAGVLLFPILGICIPWRPLLDRAEGRPTFRVLTCNITGSALDQAAFSRLVEETAPDLVVMQECYDVDPTPLLPGPGWNHARSAPELMVASRHPLRLVDRIDLRRERRGGSAAEFEITWNGRAIRVVDVHAASLRKGFDALIQRDPDAMTAFMSIAMIHREEAEHARSWIARGDGPLIVAGDFNAAADNPTFRAVWGDLEDAYTVASWGLGSTYSTRLMRIRIDHILTGPGWRAQRAWVGPNVRSQHYPLLADLEWVGE